LYEWCTCPAAVLLRAVKPDEVEKSNRATLKFRPFRETAENAADVPAPAARGHVDHKGMRQARDVIPIVLAAKA